MIIRGQNEISHPTNGSLQLIDKVKSAFFLKNHNFLLSIISYGFSFWDFSLSLPFFFNCLNLSYRKILPHYLQE